MRKARDADVYWSTLGIAERSASGSAPTKTRGLTRKAHGADVRGAGLWPTGVHEAPWNAAREVPQLFTCGLALQDREART